MYVFRSGKSYIFNIEEMNFIWKTAIASECQTKKQNKTKQTNFIENWKITNYITFPPANSL